MTNVTRIFLASTLVIAANSAQAIEYSAVQLDKSTITFTSKQMGVPVQGRFPKFTARVAFDPAKPAAAKVDLIIDLAAIDAGSKDADDEVVGKQWFNVKAFPTASFTSSIVKAVGAGRYEVTGPLSIKGKANPVTAKFGFKTDGNNGVFDGDFTLKRIDFAIGEGPWADLSTVANEVQVNFHVVAAAAATAPTPKAK
ncbi:MAG: YceI family protein [Betaproteobacteria bacterium]